MPAFRRGAIILKGTAITIIFNYHIVINTSIIIDIIISSLSLLEIQMPTTENKTVCVCVLNAFQQLYVDASVHSTVARTVTSRMQTQSTKVITVPQLQLLANDNLQFHGDAFYLQSISVTFRP